MVALVTAPPLVTEDGRGARVGLFPLWFGLLGGPIAWSLQLLVDYPLVAHYCFPDAAKRIVPTLDSLRLLVIIVSVLALALAVAALLTAVRSWHASGGEFGDARTMLTEAAPPPGRVRFMALGGILASSLTIVGIVIHGGFILMLAPCT
jgi:hypothetical protein